MIVLSSPVDLLKEGDMKPWQTPQLIKLERGRPEEAVLGACKSGIGPGAGASPNGTNPGCYYDVPNPGCVACETHSDT